MHALRCLLGIVGEKKEAQHQYKCILKQTHLSNGNESTIHEKMPGILCFSQSQSQPVLPFVFFHSCIAMWAPRLLEAVRYVNVCIFVYGNEYAYPVGSMFVCTYATTTRPTRHPRKRVSSNGVLMWTAFAFERHRWRSSMLLCIYIEGGSSDRTLRR